jgi:DNA-binding CsgD family transcriptional regulator
LIFAPVAIAVLWLVQAITIRRQFDKKLLESDVPLTGFMEQYKLTARELEILTLIFTNQSTKEIAATLHISPETVRKHCQNIYQKTGTHSKMELLLLYNHS